MRFLGNDVVDLDDPANRASAANPRFLARVLTPLERQRVSRQQTADGLLWAFWSAKEATYKALAKRCPELPFVHRKFQVSIDPGSALPAIDKASSGSSRGSVLHDGKSIRVNWQWTPHWIHCVTDAHEAAHRVRALSECRAEAGYFEVKDAYFLSDQSAAARTLALALLRKRGVAGARIERCKMQHRAGPPFVTQHGVAVPGCDVSLSHDGRFAAAAINSAT